jgi:hypothetical protein
MWLPPPVSYFSSAGSLSIHTYPSFTVLSCSSAISVCGLLSEFITLPLLSPRSVLYFFVRDLRCFRYIIYDFLLCPTYPFHRLALFLSRLVTIVTLFPWFLGAILHLFPLWTGTATDCGPILLIPWASGSQSFTAAQPFLQQIVSRNPRKKLKFSCTYF